MNKHIQKFFYATALFGALAGMAVSCKDYSDDIDKLDTRVSALETTVGEIQGKVNGGAVITAVNSITNGVEVVLSDGKSFKIYNGKDGSGKDGSVLTIEEDGYWYIDGKKTEYKATGDSGKDGDDATAIYYYPGTDGYWVKVVVEPGKDPVESKTTIPCFATGDDAPVTAVWDSERGTLSIYNAEGAEDGKPVVIYADSKVRSLVFVPQVYVDGVEGMNYASMTYNPLLPKDTDSEKEVWDPAEKSKNIVPTVYAEYHVNPATAEITKEDTLAFVVKANTPFATTRAKAEDFKATPTFESYKDGILKVKVDIEGVPATEEYISVLALKLTPKVEAGQETQVVVSDYATVFNSALDDIVIANSDEGVKKDKFTDNDDYHYRTKIAEKDADAYLQELVWSANTDLKATKATCDTAVAYDGSLDLNGIVAAHNVAEEATGAAAKCTVADLDNLGLKFVFQLVKNYKLGKPETDQADFVTIKDGILTPRVYDTEGKAAIGRTPIIRVLLLPKDQDPKTIKDVKEAVKVAYIKVFIEDVIVGPVDNSFKMDVYEKDGKTLGTFEFSCGDADTLWTIVPDMNTEIYNVLGLSKWDFHDLYSEFQDWGADGKAQVTAEDEIRAKDIVNDETEATHVIAWWMTTDDLWNAKSDSVFRYVKYVSKSGNEVTIKLGAPVKAANKTYNLEPGPDYIREYWNDDKTITFYNVRVPDLGEETPENCTFVNNINASFVTWTAQDAKENPKVTAGKVKLDKTVTGMEYYFCKDVKNIKKIGEYAVTFSRSADSLQLLASAKVGDKEYKDELIATISNDGSAIPWNYVTYNKESELAKILLNTNEMYTYIGATGYICDSDDRPVTITFYGKDHFQANFVRPINITDKAADNFVDAVDFGEEGSWIRLEDLIAPSDWRNRKFSDYENYWGYYGPFSFELVDDATEDDLNGERGPVDANIVLELDTTNKTRTDAKGKTVESKYGFITYRNNGTHVKSYNLYVKVKVKYGWGEIDTDFITVPVAETIGDTNE